MIALLAFALIASVVAYAGAETGNVAVTARVNPAFSMSVANGVINWAGVALDATYQNTDPVITVKSNKLWDFTKDAPVIDPALQPLIAESTSLNTSVGNAKGVTAITTQYDLNLTLAQAWDLDPGTDYSAAYTYTATQQP